MIHQYKNNGYNIVMDVASGSVHVVDDVVYDAISMLEPVMGELERPEPIPAEARARAEELLKLQYPGEDVAEALSEVQELIDGRAVHQGYVPDLCCRF